MDLHLAKWHALYKLLGIINYNKNSSNKITSQMCQDAQTCRINVKSMLFVDWQVRGELGVSFHEPTETAWKHSSIQKATRDPADVLKLCCHIRRALLFTPLCFIHFLSHHLHQGCFLALPLNVAAEQRNCLLSRVDFSCACKLAGIDDFVSKVEICGNPTDEA